MMPMRRFLLALAALLSLGTIALGDVTIKLLNSWVNTNKNRVLLTVSIKPTHAQKTPKYYYAPDGSGDYDIHIAGKSNSAKMPYICEIMNSQDRQDLIELVSAKIAEKKYITVKGVARLWCEHADGQNLFQQTSSSVPAPTGTNPKHVFEVHPVTEVAGVSAFDTLRPIQPLNPPGPHSKARPSGADDFPPKKAINAFSTYAGLECTLSRTSTHTTITTTQTGNNYVHFRLLKTSPTFTTMTNGKWFMARVIDPDTGLDVLTQDVKMVLVNGSSASTKIQADPTMPHDVLGMPRINLKAISEMAPTSVKVPLPYEIVVLGAY